MSDLDPIDQETIKQLDTKRLQVMERYCYTTECLRNYILKYFGENPQKPCEDCGNCLREFETMDMTDAAKKIINCVHETKETYGKNIIIDIVTGANTARLREIGAFEFKTYGVLSKTNKKLLRRLIEQLVLEGYLWVGDYQVIKKGEMLNVSGVGENKYMKYGNRFLSLIEACIEDDPELIQSKAQVGQSEETCYMTSTYKKGLKLGVREIEKISQKGNPYTVLMYPENVQRLLVEHYICNDIDG